MAAAVPGFRRTIAVAVDPARRRGERRRHHHADSPADFHFPRHTHRKSESTFLVAGTHYFEDCDAGKIFRIEAQGYFHLPAHHVHQAWVRAGSLLVAVLDGGAQIDWIDPPPQPGAAVHFPDAGA